MITQFLIAVLSFAVGVFLTMSIFGSHRAEAAREREADDEALAQAEHMNIQLARELGLMEAQRNHARWKAGVRKRKMREMRTAYDELRYVNGNLHIQIAKLQQPLNVKNERQTVKAVP